MAVHLYVRYSFTRARGLSQRADGEIVVKRLPYVRSSLSGSTQGFWLLYLTTFFREEVDLSVAFFISITVIMSPFINVLSH